MVLDQKPIGVSFPPEAVVLVVEVWSPGDKRAERQTEVAAYASAGVPCLWTVEQPSHFHGLKLSAYRLQDEEYALENVDTTCRLEGGHHVVADAVQAPGPVTTTAAPVPVIVDLGGLGL